MAWLSVRVRCQGTEADAVSEALTTAGSAALSLEAADSEWLCDDPGAPEAPELLWAEVWVCALFPAETAPGPVLAAVTAALARVPVHTLAQLEDQDWEASVRAHFPPRHFPPRLWVYPSWAAPPADTCARVELDPGLAFGTGQHPTTALCLAWLSEQSGRWGPDTRVLDYGCGSGILAIAALKLGAASALGVDIDPHALEVARANAVRNGVDLALALPESVPPDPADIVLANILARPLIELAPLLMGTLQPGGSLLLSGFTPDQAGAVANAFENLTLHRREQEGWVLLYGQRDF